MMLSSALGYVLAGGESSRMQRNDLPRDKALLKLGGITLLERALATLAQACPDPRILCGSEERCARLRHLGLTVPDGVLLAGPLGGLDAALRNARGGGVAWTLVLPVDLPWMPSAVLSAFLRCAQASGADVACMRHEGSLQPLPVAIRTDAGSLLTAALMAGERKLMPVLRSIGEGCGTQAGLFIIDAEALVPSSTTKTYWFRNVNTPADFEAAQHYETLGSALHQNNYGG